MLLSIKLYDSDQLDIQIYYKTLWSRLTGYSDTPGYNMLLSIKLYHPDQLDIQIYLDTICSYLISAIIQTYWISRYTWIKYVFTYKAQWSRSTGYSDIPGYNMLLSITIIQIYWIQYFVIYNNDSNLLDIQIYLDTICCFLFSLMLYDPNLWISGIFCYL